MSKYKKQFANKKYYIVVIDDKIIGMHISKMMFFFRGKLWKIYNIINQSLSIIKISCCCWIQLKCIWQIRSCHRVIYILVAETFLFSLFLKEDYFTQIITWKKICQEMIFQILVLVWPVFGWNEQVQSLVFVYKPGFFKNKLLNVLHEEVIRFLLHLDPIPEQCVECFSPTKWSNY